MINFATMDLFNQIYYDPKDDIKKVSGLICVENYLSKSEHDLLLNTIDCGVWLNDLKRRVQHYGFKYDYKAKRINLNMKIGKLPNWAELIAEKLLLEGYFKEVPDQLIVNEYLPGQGITPHIDCEPCFEDTIASISLGSKCVMDFENEVTKEKIPVLLHPRSLIILKDDSRYNWTHGIAPRKTDKLYGETINRQRRVSLTFRKTII